MTDAQLAETGSVVDCTARSLRDWCLAHDAPYHEFAAWSDPLPRLGEDAALMSERPAMFAGQVPNARSLPHDGYVVTSDNHIIYRGLGARDYLPVADLGARCVASDGEYRFRLSLAGKSHRVAQECVYFGGNKNFGHFIFQCLMRLVGLQWLPAAKELPLAVYEGLPSRYLQFLDLLGFTAARRITIPMDAVTHFDRVWLLSSPLFRRRGGKAQVWPEAIWGLRMAVAANMPSFHSGRSRIYIQRGEAGWRRLVNEADVLKLLKPYGVVPTELSALTAAEQVRAVSNAELIVVVLGAASAITTFAPPDCAIIELAPPEMVGSFGSIAYADVLGQPFARVVGCGLSTEQSIAAGLTPPPSTNVIDKDFSIDTESLSAYLAAAEAYCRREPPA